MAGLINNNVARLMEKSLDFRAERQNILSSNIANKDTPNYKAEDLVFEGNLRKALQADQPGPMRTTHEKHFDGNFTRPIDEVSADRIRSAAPFVDFNGNSVDLDEEMAKMAENQLMYNATTRLVSHHFKMLKTAITEGR